MIKCTIILVPFITCLIFFQGVCSYVCAVTVENNTAKSLDSIKLILRSNNTYSCLLTDIQATKSCTKVIDKEQLKLGHYFSIETIIYSKDSTYKGPEISSDMIFGGEKYRIIINEKTTRIKME